MTTATSAHTLESPMTAPVFVVVSTGTSRKHLATLSSVCSYDWRVLCGRVHRGLAVEVQLTDNLAARVGGEVNCRKCTELARQMVRTSSPWLSEEYTVQMSPDGMAQYNRRMADWDNEMRQAKWDRLGFLDRRDDGSRQAYALATDWTEAVAEQAWRDEFNLPGSAAHKAAGPAPLPMPVTDCAGCDNPPCDCTCPEPVEDDPYASPEHESVFARETFPVLASLVPERVTPDTNPDELTDPNSPVAWVDLVRDETPSNRAVDLITKAVELRDAYYLDRALYSNGTAESVTDWYRRTRGHAPRHAITTEPKVTTSVQRQAAVYQAGMDLDLGTESRRVTSGKVEPYAATELGQPFIPGRTVVEHEQDRGNYGRVTKSNQSGVWVEWDDTPGHAPWQYGPGELRIVRPFNR